ncbi:type II toxin-antitoxin system Phd/YefM family antitoxin [Brevundimonas sp.]|uniref:type II toxin-antitoxin system Phd/YefM family antitoxin n=1 Tax=Brevundimonas sp. TaxID=1871086 RepID=UPI003A91F587
MSCYSVAEAKNNFSKVLAAAERGEPVSITRRGKIVADVVAREPARPFRIDVEELKRRRVMPKKGPTDTVAALEEMRNERSW